MQEERSNVDRAIDIAVKLGALAIVLYVSFLIVRPFLGIAAWAVILAVALFPVVEKLAGALGLSRKKTLIALSISANLLLIVPTYMLSDTTLDSLSRLGEVAKRGKLQIPQPNVTVKEWPLIGDEIYTLWQEASMNLEATLQKFAPQIKHIAAEAIRILSEALVTIVFTMIAFIVAALLMLHAEKYVAFYMRLSKRFLGYRGEEWARLSALTIRSVANGVIGVAAIQAALALLGMVVYGIPFAALLAIIIMFLTIVQLPTIVVIGPLVAWILSQDTSVTAIAFSVYMLIVGAIDGVLKPIFMGRGVDIPMLVVLIGAIGGMLLMGMIGLFIGAVVFALAYKLFLLWIGEEGTVAS